MFSNEVESQYLIHRAKAYGIDFVLKGLTQAQAQDSMATISLTISRSIKWVRYFTKSQKPNTRAWPWTRH
ncbi:hypothetical protein L211DRAFT_839148 [Terfezia boudieri ATCC MYA-4762]|uniref:Uncharacterized protein n=1 Tax=Terfezia boudieri ATCC MYA-4762 TaxID=1051890 RepID=A0A3N4LJT0_9PEZI|nr:hypothetical protein L211DRAFT_839148 [Terfezia boudieri ATCC MYA-4762]